MSDLSVLVRKSDEYARGQLKAWHIDERFPERESLYWSVFTGQLAYLLDHPDGEIMIGRREYLPKVEVGGTIYCDAGAPGCGHIIYRVTRIEDQGDIYGVILEDTIRVMEPEECI